METNEGVRLQVYMARCGVASRRHCEEFITSGDVKINGKTVTRLGTRVFSGDEVKFKGKLLRPSEHHRYIALNKPRAYLCSSSHDEDKPIALDLVDLSPRERLYTVGRLDYLSSGLILLTNDGDFAQSASHPSKGVEKEYLVESRDPIPDQTLEEFRSGIIDEGVSYRISRYTRKTPRKVLLVLQEGKNREIRRLFAARNIGVTRIHRVRIGPVRIGKLAPGQYRPLTEQEKAWFLKDARSRDSRR